MSRSTTRVAWQDVPFAKGAIWVVCGPIAPLTPELAARTLNNMASHGPKTRIGLIPTAGTRRWAFDDRPGDTAVDTDLTFANQDVNQILTQFMTTSPKVPIQIIAPGGGDYVCVYFDHGVGDAHLIIELFTALSQAGRYADFVPPIPGSLRTPLLTCFANATKADPKGMWTEAYEWGKTILARRGAATSAPASTGSSPQVPAVAPAERGSATAVFVKSRVGYIDELRAYRNDTQQTATVTTYVIRSVYNAFRDAGINVADDILVMIDLRRFLPEGQWSLANLSAPVQVSVTPEMSPDEFTAAAFWQVASRKPLLRMMGRSVAARLMGLPAAEDAVGSRDPNAHAGAPLTLSFSDVTKIPAAAKVSWKPGTEPEDINLAIALQAPDPSYVNICMITAKEDRAIHLTATFYDSRIDPELVRKALDEALETPGSPRAQ